MKAAKIALIAIFASLAPSAAASAAEPAKQLWTEEAVESVAKQEHWWERVWADVHLHRKRVNAWPEPFNIPDRELVRDPFRIMADNGWKLQNTFGDHLFTPETNELTYAGEMKLQWLLTQVPPHRRQIYVLQTSDQAGTSTRIASVYKHIAKIAPNAVACPVQTTRIVPRGGDGSYLDNLDQTYRSSMPLPRLPASAPPVGATIGVGQAAGAY